MQTIEKKKREGTKVSSRGARRTRTHILKRASFKSDRHSSQTANRTKRDESTSLISLELKASIKPLEVAKSQDSHPIFGESSSVKFLKHLHQCLSNNDKWDDAHTWSKEISPQGVIRELFKDLEDLLPQGTHTQYDEEKSKLYYHHEARLDGCQFPASCFLPQLKQHNLPLYNLVATTISHLSSKCGFSLWDGDIEYEAVDYLEQVLADPDFYGLEIEDKKERELEINRWNNTIFPYAQEIRELSRVTTIETVIDEVNNFDWPDTFTSKRVFLWFHQAFKLILSGFHVNSCTHFEADDHEDGPPLLPEDTFKFTWPSTLDESIHGFIAEHIKEILNERAGNFGIIPLTEKLEFTSGWGKFKYSFSELENLCDSTISLWLEPELRDFFKLQSIKTRKITEKNGYQAPRKYYKPVSWKPKKCAL